MKVVILAGGMGTRLAEETLTRPKPMVDIGERPILWHIMKHYGHHGFSDFLIALGYLGQEIKRYFLDSLAMEGSMTLSFPDQKVVIQDRKQEDWIVHLVDTGRTTATGGRLKRLANWIDGEPVMLTYGDGVCDVDLRALLEFHRGHGRLATILAVHPPSRFGALEFEPGSPALFTEKPQIVEGWINGGFMVLQPEVLELIEGDDSSLELDVLESLSLSSQLMAYPHETFWQCMDTMRDVRYLRSLWERGDAPWATWEQDA